jgi:hypothetical protein
MCDQQALIDMLRVRRAIKLPTAKIQGREECLQRLPVPQVAGCDALL